MGKNEIKLRRQRLDPDDIGRYRDYNTIMHQHKRHQRNRQFRKIFNWTMLATLVILLLLIIISYVVVRLERKRASEKHAQVQVSKNPGVLGNTNVRSK